MSGWSNLRVPGPTPVLPPVLARGAEPVFSHRGPEFLTLCGRLQQALQSICGCAEPVLIFPGAGTGAMEAGIVNSFSPGDRVLAASCGHFGERLGSMAEAFGLSVDWLQAPWGSPVDPGDVEQALRRASPPIRGLLVTHNETSTGVTNDLEAICRVARRYEVLVVADCISSLAALPCPVDEWGIDVLLACSQKALGVPPGLALVGVTARGVEAAAVSTLPRFYWDFGRMRVGWAEGRVPYTPPMSLLACLDAATELLLAEGLDAVHRRHAAAGAAVRAGLGALDLELVASGPWASDTVSAFYLPPAVEAARTRALLEREHGVVLAGGQGELKGRVLRIGHMGAVSLPELTHCLTALGCVLARSGVAVDVAAAAAGVVDGYSTGMSADAAVDGHATAVAAAGHTTAEPPGGG